MENSNTYDISEDRTDSSAYTATLEAVLFMHGAPVQMTRLAEILALPKSEVMTAIQDLQTDYEKRDGGLRIIIHEDAVQMVTEKSQSEIIEKFTRRELEGDLSQPSLEVLAIVAYRGPLSKPDIEAVRGVNCAFTLRNLLLRGLVERRPHPTDSRTKIYSVTPDLVRYLGLGDISELPHFEELIGDKRIDAVLYGEQVLPEDDELQSDDM